MLEQLNQIKETRDSILKLKQDVEGLISIDSDGEILIWDNQFKEIAAGNEYKVHRGYADKSLLFYEAEINGCIFKTNTHTPLFENDLEVK